MELHVVLLISNSIKSTLTTKDLLPMKKLGILFTATLIFAFTGCKDGKKDIDDVNDIDDTVQIDTAEKEVPKTLSVVLEPKSDSGVRGEAYFTEENGVVRMNAKFSGMKAGEHAIHLHEKADCSAADGSSAGGHWNPTHEKHGKWGDDQGYHRGDIGNFEAQDDGSGEITFETELWCIGCGDDKKDIIGKSIIVHEAEDDYVSQPTGNAGGRVACGGVIK